MSLRRFVPERVFVRALVPSFALALGCSDQQPQRVRLLVAPEAACGSSTTWLRDVGCFQITVCPEAGQDTTECAQVAPQGAISNPDAVGRSLVVGVRGDQFGFSVAADSSVSYNVEVTAFTATTGNALAMGQARGVRFSRGGPMVEVMLSPMTDSWTCPGGIGTRRIERAFHQAVALPSGEVLLIGGINRGVEISAMMLNPAAALIEGENAVEVFQPGADTLEFVTVVGDATTFSRALFDARWIARDGNVDRIRLFGGVSGTGRVAFSLNSLSAGPVAASGTSLPPAIVDVLYDRVARTITVDETPVSMVPVTAVESTIGALPSLSRPQTSQGVYGNAGMAGRFAIVNTPPMISTVDVPMEARRGGTLSRFGAGWLVYGGNDMTVQMMSMRDAGLALLSATGTLTVATFPATLEPSAFHTATPVELSATSTTLGDEAIIFVGGIPLSPTSDAPLYEPTVSPGLGVRGVRMVGATIEALTGTITDPVRERAFHTATLDAQDRVVVIGGTVLPRETPMVTNTRLASTATAYAIRVVGGVMQQEVIASLRQGRFGHATTLLPTGRLLVTGGLRSGVGGAYEIVGEPEMLFVARRPAALDCSIVDADAGAPNDAAMSTLDARVGVDVGSVDAGVALVDAPTSDAPSGEDAP